MACQFAQLNLRFVIIAIIGAGHRLGFLNDYLLRRGPGCVASASIEIGVIDLSV